MRTPSEKTKCITRIATFSALMAAETSVFAEEKSGSNNPLLIIAGAGVINRPEYHGSDDSETRVLPLISLRYKRFFLGGLTGFETGLGVMMIKTPSTTLALVASRDIDKPRDESYDERFEGLPDIDRSTLGGLYVSYGEQWYTLHSSILTDIENGYQGTHVNVGGQLNHTFYPRLNLSAGTKVTFGNAEYMETFFAVDEKYTTSSGYAPYHTQSGLASVELSFGVRYQLTQRLGVSGNLAQQRYVGDAKDSPVVHQDHQNRFGLFMMYRF